MSHRVFISYVQLQKPLADAICTALESRGISCWMAPRNIATGAEWAGAIIQGIHDAEAFILLLSSHTVASKHVLRELECASDQGKILLPLRTEPVELPPSFAYYMSVVQWFDGFPGPPESHLAAFADSVQDALDHRAPSPPPRHALPPHPHRRFSWNIAAAIVALAGLVALALAAFHYYSAPAASADAADPSSDPVQQKLIAQLSLAHFDPPDKPQPDHPWTNSLGMKFVPVPASPVLFCIYKPRLQDFEKFVAATGYDASAGVKSLGMPPPDDGWTVRGHTWKNPGFPQSPIHPVCGVSFDDGVAFCAWLTQREQNAGILARTQSYRLPTDLEWSAAVGLAPESPTTPHDRNFDVRDTYPWGTQYPPPPNVGNYAGSEAWDQGGVPATLLDKRIQGYRDGYRRTSPPGAFPPNRFGLYDLGGNLWEWTMDDDDPLHAPGLKTLRGGSWASTEQQWLLSSARLASNHDSRYTGCGFRCVLLVAPPAATTSASP